MTRGTEAVLTLQSRRQEAVVNLSVGSDGSQTWAKTNGVYDLGSRGGLWELGPGPNQSTRIVVLYDGSYGCAPRLIAALENVPANFMQQLRSSCDGTGDLVVGRLVKDFFKWNMDVHSRS